MVTIIALIIGITSVTLYRNRSYIKEEVFRVCSYFKLKQIKTSDTQYIVKHYSEYPSNLIKLALNNEEARSFVKNYLDEINQDHEVILTEEELGGSPPLFIQWDNRWGYDDYGNDIIGVSGCGPTAISMVIVGLLHNPNVTPNVISQYAMENGYYNENYGTMWKFMTEAAISYGIHVSEPEINFDIIEKELQEGKWLICSMGPGDFTTSGHFIVVYNLCGDTVNVNDSNSIINSHKEWKLERILEQAKHIWAYNK